MTKDRTRPSSSGTLLEAEFFTREPVRRALAGYDFDYVFRTVRRAAGLTQEELGDLLDPDRTSRIERGRRWLCDIAIIDRVASRLSVPRCYSALAQIQPTRSGRASLAAWRRGPRNEIRTTSGHADVDEKPV